MNVIRGIVSLRSSGAWLAAAWLSLLASPAGSYADSREAIRKAVAATVAVEWRADAKAGQQPSQQNTSARRVRESAIEVVEPGRQPGPANVRWTFTARQADLALASGVVVSANGLVVTLNRERDGRHDVIFADGHTLPARVVVDDHRSGLRLLKVDATDLPHVALADAEAELWDQVFVAFCTDRQERTVLQGMVTMPYKTNKLHLNLSAGPMSGGGALVSEQGSLVGILSDRSSEGRTTSSAVRLRDIRALLSAQQGENTVVVHRGFLGVQLDTKQEGGRERVIVHLLDDSPARAAGMLDGDQLVTIAGEKITSMAEAAAAVARHSPGERISVVVLRDGQEKPLEITVGRPPATLESAQDALEPRQIRSRLQASVVHPEKLYVLSEDGKKVAVVAEGEQVEALRTYARALRLRTTRENPYQASEPTVSTIRVERSDLDKKLEELGHTVDSLQQQVKKLTEEIQALRSKLAEGQ